MAGLPANPAAGEPVLEVAGLTTNGGDAALSLVLRGGEVLGLYGLVGAGRSSLAKTLIGEIKATGGEVRVRGVITHIRSFREVFEKYRFGYVSEDRKQEGLILLHSVRANTSITIWRRLRSLAQCIRHAAEHAASLPPPRHLDARAQAPSQPRGTLSGRNQDSVRHSKSLHPEAD